VGWAVASFCAGAALAATVSHPLLVSVSTTAPISNPTVTDVLAKMGQVLCPQVASATGLALADCTASNVAQATLVFDHAAGQVTIVGDFSFDGTFTTQ